MREVMYSYSTSVMADDGAALSRLGARPLYSPRTPSRAWILVKASTNPLYSTAPTRAPVTSHARPGSQHLMDIVS
jgi:hypothetical protein